MNDNYLGEETQEDYSFLEEAFKDHCDKQFIKLLDDAVPERERRDYLGASAMGSACDRQLWYSYNEKVKPEKYSSRIIRTFNLGHMVEELVKRELSAAGFKIEAGAKFADNVNDITVEGHVDGVITESPLSFIEVPCIIEIKSMNTYKFKKLVKGGVKNICPEYYIQVQCYMHYILSFNPALFFAVDKNSSEVYHELIPYDKGIMEDFIEEKTRILNKKAIPPVPEGLTWQCGYCDFEKKCKENKENV